MTTQVKFADKTVAANGIKIHYPKAGNGRCLFSQGK